MDIDKDIQHIEAEIIRLKRQKEQEKAMVEVLPVRFESNMRALKNHIPSVYEQFKDYNPTRPFRFFCNESGIPNILWLDSNVSFYGEDPYQYFRLVILNYLSAISSEEKQSCIARISKPTPLRTFKLRWQ